MRRALPWVTGLVGAALVLVGAVVLVLANRAGVPDVGWTAYAPLEPEVTSAYSSDLVLSFDGWTVLWTGAHLLGVLLTGLGLLLLTGLAGWLLGRRSGRRPTPRSG